MTTPPKTPLHDSLSPRERDVAYLLLTKGSINKQIAWALNISEGSVKIHMRTIFHKIGAQNRVEVALAER